MPFINCFEKIPAIKIRKRMGRPMSYGWIIYGWSQYGEDNKMAGVYQQRYRRLNFWQGLVTSFYGLKKYGSAQYGDSSLHSENLKGKKKNFFMRPCWPTQPASAKRDAQQAKFKIAIGMWQNLTNEQKMVYNKKGSRERRKGFEIFMSKTLKAL
jgi:hypothetical protein